MTEPVPARQTWFPQYTIRQILIVTAGFSVVFVVCAQAVRGALWAIAVSIGVLAVAGTLLVQAAFFGMIWLAYLLYDARRQRQAGSESPAQATADPGS